jgi:uncharacterized protein (TIGR00369 family)
VSYWQSLLERIRDGDLDAPQGIETTRLRVRVDDGLTWKPGVVTRRWTLGPWAQNKDGTVFGGLIAALADQMTSFAAFTVLADDEASRTASLQVDYFRPVVGPYVEVEARIVNRSRRLIHTETEIRRHDGKVGAHARAVLAIVPFEQDLESQQK